MLKRENGRLANECNQLHQQLIQEAEEQDKHARSHYQSTKRLEAEIAELSFWKQQMLDRLSSLEKENQGLKRQMQLTLHESAEFPSGETLWLGQMWCSGLQVLADARMLLSGCNPC